MRKVEAVKTESQRIQIETLLASKDDIYLDVWKYLLNTALRISDGLSISMADLQQLDNDRPCLKITEQKTGKCRSILLNEGAIVVIRKRQQQKRKDVLLFQSTSNRIRRGYPQFINRRSVARVLEDIEPRITPNVRLGCHSGRKTRGYCLYASGHTVEKISKILNQSSISVTMRYTGITQSDIDDSYTELVL